MDNQTCLDSRRWSAVGHRDGSARCCVPCRRRGLGSDVQTITDCLRGSTQWKGGLRWCQRNEGAALAGRTRGSAIYPWDTSLNAGRTRARVGQLPGPHIDAKAPARRNLRFLCRPWRPTLHVNGLTSSVAIMPSGSSLSSHLILNRRNLNSSSMALSLSASVSPDQEKVELILIG